jgi:uncharacterized RDD family membrane protein YckC
MNPFSLSLLLLILALNWCASWNVLGQAPDEPLEQTAEPTVNEEERPARSTSRSRSGRSSLGDLVVFGNDVTVKENETAHDVVVIGGSAIIDGKVTGDLVVVLGRAQLGPKSEVRRDLTVVGGTLDVDPGAKISRHRVVVGGNHKILQHLVWLKWPSQWFNTGLLMARPLPHQYGWSWAVAGIAFLLYVVIAVLFPRQVQASVTALEERPGNALLTGFLAFMLVGPVLLLLALTVIGLAVIPFAICAMIAAFLFGKVAVYRYAGHQIGTQTGWSALQNPLLALFVGALLFCLIYTVPVLGFMVWGAVAPLGLGAVLLALFNRRSKSVGTTEAGPTTPPVNVVMPDATTTSPPPPTLLPRVGFWLRLLATALDLALVSVVVAAFFHRPQWFLPAWVVYHLVLWSWQGTTLGGIILGLKIVRTDGRPINFAIALVRLLGSFFSAAVLGLGFFWAGWSQSKESWHDKIAGTVVVKFPRNTPLL